MTLDEKLSRLLDGDLPEAEAAVLRGRIEADPAVAAAWVRMQALAERLDAGVPPARAMPEVRVFPGQIGGGAQPSVALASGVPPTLANQRARDPGLRPWAQVRWFLLGAGIAAGLLLSVPDPVAEVTLSRGETVLSGHVFAVAGQTRIEVDGKIRATLEPAGPLGRGSGSESPMDRSHVLASLAGAALTLVVEEGRAILRTPDAADRTLVAGESASITVDAVVSGEAPSTLPSASPASPATLAALQRELAALKLEQALVRGQLTQATGAPQGFPPDLPAPFRPDEFSRRLAESVAGHPEISLVETNCDEYPCLGVLRTSHEGEGWQDSLEAVLDTMKADGPLENSHAMEWISNLDTDQGEVKMLVFTLWPDGGENAGAATRTKYRAEDLMQSAAEAGPDGEP